MRGSHLCLFTALGVEQYRETCAVDVIGEDRWREVTVVREDENKLEGEEKYVKGGRL